MCLGWVLLLLELDLMLVVALMQSMLARMIFSLPLVR